MADVYIPMTSARWYGTFTGSSGMFPAQPANTYLTYVGDDDDATGWNLVWEYGDSSKQTTGDGTLDPATLSADLTDADVTNFRYQFRYKHDYADPVPDEIRLHIVEHSPDYFDVTVTDPLPAVAGFTTVVVPASNGGRGFSATNIRAGHRVHATRRNSFGDAGVIQVSELGLLVTIPDDRGGLLTQRRAFKARRRL